jgi:hypothetical protein
MGCFSYISTSLIPNPKTLHLRTNGFMKSRVAKIGVEIIQVFILGKQVFVASSHIKASFFNRVVNGATISA